MTRRATAVLVGVWALTTFLWLHPGIVIPDGAGYYVYLPSITLDHDLLFFDEWAQLGMIGDSGVIRFKDVTANGHLANHWTSGSAIAWAPAYLLGHALAPAFGFPRNGFLLPYNVTVIFTSAVAGLIALLLGMRAAARYGEGNALTAALAVWVGSPLMWYSLRHATMSHAIGAAACAAVVWLSMRESPNYFAIGLAVGFAFAVRPQNAPFILVPFILDRGSLLPRWIASRLDSARRQQAAALQGGGKTAALLFAGALIGALPQLVVSQILWGSPLAFANVGGQGNDWQSFRHFRLFEVLFSSYHGLAIWTPLLLFAIAGFVFLEKRLRIAAISMFAIQWLMIATLDRAFWGGAAFGQRRFDNCTIFFILGLAALFARIPRWASIAIAVVPSIWTLKLFFTPLDLNVYQPLSQLIHTNADVRLSFVPPQMRLTAWGLMLATAALLALLAWLARFRPTLIAASYLVAFSVVFAICGLRDDPARYRALIDRNRAHPTGTIMTTILVIRNEARWLEETGDFEGSTRAAREAEELAKAAGLR